MEPDFGINPNFLRLLAMTRGGGLPPALQLSAGEGAADPGQTPAQALVPPSGGAPERPDPSGGVTGILQRLFAGRPSEAFENPEAQEQAFGDAMFKAGLRMVLESGSPDAGGLASILARGMLEGQSSYSEFELAALERAAERGRQNLLQQFVEADDEQLGSTLRGMIAGGMLEEVKTALDVIKATQPQPTEAERLRFTDFDMQTDDGPVRIQVGSDPHTGEVVRATPLGPVPPDFKITPQQRMKNGVMHQVLVDQNGVELQDLGPMPQAGGAGLGGAMERINQRLGTMMQNAQVDLEAPGIDASLSHPIVGGLANLVHAGGFRGFLAQGALSLFKQGQIANAARERWVAPAVRLMSGAQMTQQERWTYRFAYTTQPFDPPQVIQQKAMARALFSSIFADPEMQQAFVNLPQGQAGAVLDQILAAAGAAPGAAYLGEAVTAAASEEDPLDDASIISDEQEALRQFELNTTGRDPSRAGRYAPPPGGN